MVIPVLNEEEAIGMVLEELKGCEEISGTRICSSKEFLEEYKKQMQTSAKGHPETRDPIDG